MVSVLSVNLTVQIQQNNYCVLGCQQPSLNLESEDRLAPATRNTSRSRRNRFWLAGTGLLCSISVALMAACEVPKSPPASSPTLTQPALSAKQLLDAATAAAKEEHTGHIESHFTLDAEIAEGKIAQTMGIAGDFRTPDSAHLAATYGIEYQLSVDIGGSEAGESAHSGSLEWITDEEVVYLLDPIEGTSRHASGRIDLPFALSDLLKFDLVDSGGEISVYEQMLDGERVYHITGPAAESGTYPGLGRASGVDGLVEYWIGAEDLLLRKLEVSVVSVGSTHVEETLRLKGFVAVSDYGKSVDIRPPEAEGTDDHGNSPAEATEIAVGKSVDATVDSWLDSDYFRFQGEEGRLYLIVAVNRGSHRNVYGFDAALFGPDGVTTQFTHSYSSGQMGTRTVWEAPATDTYYLRVESGQEETANYTLTITLLPEMDDYGDAPSTAHEIGVAELVEGMIGHLSDRDYFKFTAEKGQIYRIDVSSPRQNERPDVALHDHGGQLTEGKSVGTPVNQSYVTERMLWMAPIQGEYYVSVEFQHSNNVSPYTLRVLAITDVVDDHSDGAANATGLSIGQPVDGSLDYEFDLDYFKFSAEDGQGYKVQVDHETLRFSDLTLYASDGFTQVPLEKKPHRDRHGNRLIWMAPAGETHHLEVKSVQGATGEYTITVTAVEGDQDDHGNDALNASDVLIGNAIQGSMDYEFDLDYFRFIADKGQEYQLQVNHQTLDDSRVKVYESDVQTQPTSYSSSSGRDGTIYRWMADATSEYFVEVESGSGSIGVYTIVIDALDR